MKKTTIISAALCLAFLASGCSKGQTEPESKNTVSTVETAAAVTTDTTVTAESSNASHDVKVEVVTLLRSEEGPYVYTSVVPKLIVDGKEATQINDSLSSYIKENYPLEINNDHASGMSTRLVWGVKDNIVSIVIIASETFTDYFTINVFNYDLDTLQALDDSDVVKRFGMTDEEFLSKTEGIIRKYCTNNDYDLDKSVAAVNYDKCTPFVLPDGNLGVDACIFYTAGSQFADTESVRCFNMTTGEYVIFEY